MLDEVAFIPSSAAISRPPPKRLRTSRSIYAMMSKKDSKMYVHFTTKATSAFTSTCATPGRPHRTTWTLCPRLRRIFSPSFLAPQIVHENPFHSDSVPRQSAARPLFPPRVTIAHRPHPRSSHVYLRTSSPRTATSRLPSMLLLGRNVDGRMTGRTAWYVGSVVSLGLLQGGTA